MKDFDVVKLHCLALEILSEVCDLPVTRAPDLASDPTDEASLREFRPLHQLSAGLREARFQRMDRWGNGNPVAYYDAFCRNPETGKFERYVWRYMLSNGQLILHKTFPVAIQDWKDRRKGLPPLAPRAGLAMSIRHERTALAEATVKRDLADEVTIHADNGRGETALDKFARLADVDWVAE